jgi:hypothetical protein
LASGLGKDKSLEEAVGQLGGGEILDSSVYDDRVTHMIAGQVRHIETGTQCCGSELIFFRIRIHKFFSDTDSDSRIKILTRNFFKIHCLSLLSYCVLEVL